ncbi:MAG: hypothetical protein GXY43_02135 [Clostridiaceae bacterium]|nr:hypothetical protein [Clostridiaceae bacterium]
MKKRTPAPEKDPSGNTDEPMKLRRPGNIPLSTESDESVSEPVIPEETSSDEPKPTTGDDISENSGPTNIDETPEESESAVGKDEEQTDPSGTTDDVPTLPFFSEDPSLFRDSDDLIFPETVSDDPDIQDISAVRIRKGNTVFEPRVRKFSWLKPRHIITPLVALAVVLLFIFVLAIGNQNERAASPLLIRGIAVPNDEFSFMYHYVLLENGIDILSDSSREFLASSPENGFETYRDFFLDMTAKEMQTTAILYDDAIARGYSIEQTHYDRARDYLDWITQRAAAISVDTETYIIGAFGKNVTSETIRTVLARKYFAEDYAYGPKLEELRASDDQAEEAYLTSPNQYDQVSYRLLRIVFEDKEPSYIATAHLHAREIIEKIGHDQSKFETVAAEYFSGEDKDRLLQPDSTLIYGTRFSQIEDPEWRVWLFDPERRPGDCIIYEDGDGFPILICFSKRERQTEPLRDIRIVYMRREDLDNGISGIPESEIVPQSRILLHSISDEASLIALETEYKEWFAEGILSFANSTDTYRGKLNPAFDSWIFDPDRKSGNTTTITVEDGIAILFFVSVSDNPEWFDRVNTFIRMNNFEEFLFAKQEEYPCKFNELGLKDI